MGVLMRYVSALEAVSDIRSGMSVFVHGGAATPHLLLDALVSRAQDLRDVELIHLHTEGDVPYAQPQVLKSFKVTNLFVGPNLRKKLDYQRIDYLPCFLSEVPMLFRSGRKRLDVALIQVSPPDIHGFCTLGVSVDVALAAVETASLVIAQVNAQMPRVHGDGFIHVSKIHYFTEGGGKLPESVWSVPSGVDQQIGKNVSELIEDGSTLQVGIGDVPNAVLASLQDHRHLGVHSEMWSDGILHLIESGVIDHSRKKVHPGKLVAGFALGSQRLYQFMHDNPTVIHLGADYVNSPSIIARNPRVCAINSAVQIDLTGQICADSIGHSIISGVGGQMDFMRGAALSERGKPIIALTSRTKKGVSRVVPSLIIGAGVVTTRAHVHYVVTEYGVADLFGKTLHERSKLLVGIAHPDDRDFLEREFKRVFRGSVI